MHTTKWLELTLLAVSANELRISSCAVRNGENAIFLALNQDI
jgi:hypothetical protein